MLEQDSCGLFTEPGGYVRAGQLWFVHSHGSQHTSDRKSCASSDSRYMNSPTSNLMPVTIS